MNICHIGPCNFPAIDSAASIMSSPSMAPPAQTDSHVRPMSNSPSPSPEPQPPTWNPTPLTEMCATALRGALQYGRMPLAVIKRISTAQCHVLSEHNTLTGLPPQLVLALERCNRSLVDLNYDYWQLVWQSTSQSSSVICRQVETEVAESGVEVTYRDLYLKFRAFEESRKARLASALKSKREAAAAAAASSSPSSLRASAPKIGSVKLVSARAVGQQTQKRSWNSPSAPSSIMDKVRSKVRKTSTATAVHQQQRVAVAVMRKKEEEKLATAGQVPAVRIKPRPRPPSPIRRSGGAGVVKELRDPSEVVAEHVRKVMQERRQGKEAGGSRAAVAGTQPVKARQVDVGRGAASKVAQGGGLLKMLGID
ncbi:hypothetical protein BCR44DRAFT_1427470 [Catenaria anguillulae PL171]|uniref:Uncharacterized protein n=1 Tax=Catenaria anguillulae PL171 TaxID=765915 RepID=A0A1Y2HXA3_9FUNG|nr:hypothetical protein BCR44DRAFT_1427470 [Catenaria anguillulae PL171]